MFTDEGKITEKSLLPIQSWSYGPLHFETEKMTVTVGSLRCDPNPSEREEKSMKMKVIENENNVIEIEREIYDELSVIKSLINTTEADVRNDMLNLHEQIEVGTKSQIDNLKENIKSSQPFLSEEDLDVISRKLELSIVRYNKVCYNLLGEY